MPEEEFEIVSSGACSRTRTCYVRNFKASPPLSPDRPGFIGQVPLSVLLRRTHTTDNSLRGSPGSRIPRGLIKNSHNVRRGPPSPPLPSARPSPSPLHPPDFFPARRRGARRLRRVWARILRDSQKELPKMQPGPGDPCHQFVRDTLSPRDRFARFAVCDPRWIHDSALPHGPGPASLSLPRLSNHRKLDLYCGHRFIFSG